ncbi:MAG: hypothetical protein IKR17_05980 [Bacteroidales bacterium]|nr:hypothetical protein [Bacteroidales bacterium]
MEKKSSSMRGDGILLQLSLFGSHINTFGTMLTDDQLRDYYRYCNQFIAEAQRIQKQIVATHEKNKQKKRLSASPSFTRSRYLATVARTMAFTSSATPSGTEKVIVHLGSLSIFLRPAPNRAPPRFVVVFCSIV